VDDRTPPMTTVAGVPAKVVGEAGCATPSVTMDQLLKDATSIEG
jgi:serine O-acetyltransferase